jgi:hypothetical protein
MPAPAHLIPLRRTTMGEVIDLCEGDLALVARFRKWRDAVGRTNAAKTDEEINAGGEAVIEIIKAIAATPSAGVGGLAVKIAVLHCDNAEEELGTVGHWLWRSIIGDLSRLAPAPAAPVIDQLSTKA